MKHPIRLIALDLDGTALNAEKHLSAATRRAIEKALAAGITVAVASGRAYASIPREVLDIPGIDYAITSNGAAICRTDDATRCYERLLPQRAVEQILRLLPESRALEAFVEGIPYGQEDYIADPERYGTGPGAVRYIQTTRHPVPDIRAFIREHSAGLDALDVITRDRADRAAVRRQLESAVDGIYITSSADQLLEISRRGGGKRAALQWLAEQLGVTAQETAAFGDEENDLEMIAWAGLGVAMGNASGPVRAAADIVTRDNCHDGVADVLEEILAEQQPGAAADRRNGG